MLMSATVRRPPLAVVLVALVILALGETAGAAMSRLKPEIQRYAAARVAANPGAHGFSGSAEYDDEVRERAIFTAEAGLSFFHLHGEGVGLVLFFASALVAALVPGQRARGALYLLLTLGGLFPLGYLAYGAAALELGRDAGIELAERWILSPLGVSAKEKKFQPSMWLAIPFPRSTSWCEVPAMFSIETRWSSSFPVPAVSGCVRSTVTPCGCAP